MLLISGLIVKFVEVENSTLEKVDFSKIALDKSQLRKVKLSKKELDSLKFTPRSLHFSKTTSLKPVKLILTLLRFQLINSHSIKVTLDS